jgi:hypothetical protein
MESTIHPKMTFLVDHVASPLRIFLTDAGSWRCSESSESSGRNTRSSLWRRTRLTWRRWCHAPWTIPMKSSTYTSHFLTAGRGRSWGARRCGIGSADGGVKAGGAPIGGDATDSERTSRRCGQDYVEFCRDWLARSATVSVAAVNSGGDCIQPIGKTNGKPMTWGSPGSLGTTTSSLATSMSFTLSL